MQARKSSTKPDLSRLCQTHANWTGGCPNVGWCAGPFWKGDVANVEGLLVYSPGVGSRGPVDSLLILVRVPCTSRRLPEFSLSTCQSDVPGLSREVTGGCEPIFHTLNLPTETRHSSTLDTRQHSGTICWVGSTNQRFFRPCQCNSRPK